MKFKKGISMLRKIGDKVWSFDNLYGRVGYGEITGIVEADDHGIHPWGYSVSGCDVRQVLYVRVPFEWVFDTKEEATKKLKEVLKQRIEELQSDIRFYEKCIDGLE